MNPYIALLRGINVSGKNKVSMPELRVALENVGFQNVRTYINSGNVVFTSDITEIQTLIALCESVILERFDLRIPVAVVSEKELSDVLNHAPEWWDIDKEVVNYLIFMIPPMHVAEVLESVGKIKPEFEKIKTHENVIFWSAPLKTFQKARWSKIASSSVNNNVTIRNANTVKKLLAMLQ